MLELRPVRRGVGARRRARRARARTARAGMAPGVAGAAVDRRRCIPTSSEPRSARCRCRSARRREAGLRTVRRPGEGRLFEGLREWVPGDETRIIDWKATARRGKPIARQYEDERRQQVLIAVDAGRLLTAEVEGVARLEAVIVRGAPPRAAPRWSTTTTSACWSSPTRSSATSLRPAADGRCARCSRGWRRRRAGSSNRTIPPPSVISRRTTGSARSPCSSPTSSTAPRATRWSRTRRPASAPSAAGGHAARSGARGAGSGPADAGRGAFERAAAEELLGAREAALAEIRSRGVMVLDVPPGAASAAVVERYHQLKRRGLL